MNQNPPDNATEPRSVDQQQACSPLFCIDCRHLYNGVFAAKLDGLFCGRTLKVKEDATDLVTGGRDTFTITLCSFERLESGQCGPTAKFWENSTNH